MNSDSVGDVGGGDGCSVGDDVGGIVAVCRNNHFKVKVYRRMLFKRR